MIWTTQDGREFEVSDMRTSHIINTLRMLKRKGYKSPSTVKFYITCPAPNGDAANDAFEQEFDDVINSPTSPFIDEFETELKKRGIDEKEFK